MGKEGDLWDDSALINAFDDAISKYKKMHGKKSCNSSVEGGKAVGGIGEDASANVSESHEARRDAEEKSNVSSSTAIDLGETSNISHVKENHCGDSRAAEPCIDSLNNLHQQNMEDACKGYSYSHGADDYNKLLNLYYELEEKRQNILGQLNQFGGWNYQNSGSGSGSGVQWGTYSTYQEFPIPASQVSHPNVVSSCCGCQCLVAPCTSCPGCSLGGTSVCKTCTDDSVAMVPGKSCPLEDSNIVKTAMTAAEKAISSMRTKISSDPNIIEGNSEKEKTEGETVPSTCSETDLTAVLNAWYSAGFYTGKYLTEQSVAKNRHS